MSTATDSIIEFLVQNATSGPVSEVQYNDFVSQLRARINATSVSVEGAQPGAVTLLYSGSINSSLRAEDVAKSLAAANPGTVLTINQTEVGQLLSDKNFEFQNALRGALGSGPEGIQRYNDLIYGSNASLPDGSQTRVNNSLWDDASHRFAANATGDVKTLTGLADSQRIYAQTELPALLNNSNVTHIDGVPKEYYNRMLNDGYTIEQVRDTATRISLINSSNLEFETNGQSVLVRTSDGSLKSVGTNNFFDNTSIQPTVLPTETPRTAASFEYATGIEQNRITSATNGSTPIIHPQSTTNAVDGINKLKEYANVDHIPGSGLLNKLGLAGDVAGLMLTASQANAAYSKGDVVGGNKILRDWAVESAGGLAGGLAAAQLVGAALSPLYAGGPAGAILAGSLTFIAGLVGGFFGGEVFKRLLDGPPDVLQNAQKYYVERALTAVSPIILDLDGNGVQTTKVGSGIYFDHDANGFAESTGWVGENDGFLVRDLNGNGRIDSGKELFGSETIAPSGYRAGNGFEALKALDSNEDGIIDSSDDQFSSLRIWKDSNADGVSNSSELYTLLDVGVKSINLDYNFSFYKDLNGNHHAQIGSYTTINDLTRDATDVWFVKDGMDSAHISSVEIPDSIKALPNIQGYGNLPDLHEAMALDSTGRLQNLLVQFDQAESTATRESILFSILNVWAGSDAFAIGSRGPNIDGRKLYFIEAFMGQEFSQAFGGGEGTNGPAHNAARDLEIVYQSLFEYAYGQLSAQTSLDTLFQKITYSWNSITQEFQSDLTQTIPLINNALAADRQDGLNLVADFVRALKGIGRLSSVNTADFQLALIPLGNDVVGIANSLWTGKVATNGIDGLAGTESVDYIRGLGGNDSIFAGNGDDFLEGGTGNDFLEGGAGNDIYIFSKGDGVDTIKDDSSPSDVIRFNLGVSTSDVVVARGSKDLYLNYGNGDRIVILNWFENTTNHIEQIRFEDGTVWSSASMDSRLVVGASTGDSDVLYGTELDEHINGLAGDDLIFGQAGNDILEGGAGNDYLEGGSGNDTYLFEVGGGNDVIDDSGSTSTDFDILKILGGVLPDNLKVHRDSANIYITLNSNDVITLRNWYGDLTSRVEKVEFDNGTEWSANTIHLKANSATVTADYIEGGTGQDSINGLGGNDQIYGLNGNDLLNGEDGNDLLYGGDGNDELHGGAGDDMLNGEAGSDWLDGGIGNDLLNGGADDDHYIFGSLHGNDKLNDISGSNTIHILDSSYQDIRVSRDIYNNLNLYIDSTGASLSLQNWFGSNLYQNSKVVFADNTEWNKNVLNQLANTATSLNDFLDGSNVNDQLNGLAGDDEIHGNDGADIITGAAGNDFLVGGNGGDTYVFNVGDGADTIYESTIDNNFSDVDQINFGTGIDYSDLVIESSGNDLLILVGNNGDQITVKNWFNSDLYRIEKLKFSNGEEINKETLHNLGKTKEGTVNPDQISITGTEDHTIHGLAGDDIISSGGGNDIVFGDDGNDSLYGNDGNDLLEGGAGNDLLIGGFGSDSIRGGGGDDILAGSVNHVENSSYDLSDNTLEGGLGNDILYGAGGKDTYIFNLGDGKDSIFESRSWDVANELDAIKLGSGITTADVTVSSDNSDLVLKIGSNNDQITIKNWYFGDVFRIDKLIFSDGTIWDKALLHNMTLSLNGTTGDDYLEAAYGSNDTTILGYAGNDTLVGKDGNDTLNGGQGNDILKGGAGYDTYVFNIGDGIDVIDDYTGPINKNRIMFGSGITSADVTVSTWGNNLLLKVGSSSDQIVIQDWHSPISRSQIDEIKFADGTIWKNPTINNLALSVFGTPGDDLLGVPYVNKNFKLYGYQGNDTLNGGTGNDILYGGIGDDTLNGNSGNNELHGEAGNDNLYSGYEGNNTLYGGEGNDSLFGQGLNNILIGGAGNDELNGGVGVDTYKFNIGDGTDIILESYQNSQITNQQDKIELGTGITTSDVSLFILKSDLIIKIGTNGDQVIVKNWFQGDEYRIESLKFSDGTVWDKLLLQSMAKTIYGTEESDGIVSPSDPGDYTVYGMGGDDYLNTGEGNDILHGGDGNDTLSSSSGNDSLYGGSGQDRLYGWDGDDVLVGGQGNDEIEGGRGKDTFIFNIGDGIDTIARLGTDDATQDVIQLGAGITTSDVVVTRNNTDLILTIGVNGDQIKVKNWYADPVNQIGELQFSNGEIWNHQALHTMGLITYGTSADDTIFGVNDKNTIFGLEGNDVIIGDTDDDILYGGSGNDTVYGNSGNDILDGGDGDDQLDGGYGSDILYGGSGNDTLSAGLTNELEYGVASNILEGGTGNDNIAGSGLSDAYIFNMGDGADTIQEYSGDLNAIDKIVFGAGITESDIAFQISSNNIVIKIGVNGDQITITNWYSGDWAQIEQLVFDNGSIWNKATIQELLQTQIGSESSDYLYGSLWDDTIHGNGGDDAIYGLTGNDVLDGGAGDDEFYGGDGDDELIGGQGYDRLYGGNGADTYVFSRGDGPDFIIEDSEDGALDSIKFQGGINFQDLKVYSFESQHLVLYFGNGDSIQIGNWFYDAKYQIERFEFSDGTILTNSQLPSLSTSPLVQTGTNGDDILKGINVDVINQIYGGDGNDTLIGTWGINYLNGGSGNDLFQNSFGTNTLVGGLGNDIFEGGNGDDTYEFNIGDGVDTIFESTKASFNDQIAFGTGISFSDLSFEKVGSSMVVHVGLGGDRIIVESWFSRGEIESFRFADGTVFGFQVGTENDDFIFGSSANDLLQGNEGNDTIYGYEGNDILDGGTGNDHLIGLSGNDTYIIDSVNDIVNEANNEGIDTVRVAIAISGDTYTLGEFVENATLINAVSYNLIGNASNNILTGNSSANILNGAAGTDTLVGGDGNDIYIVDSTTDTITETATGGIDTVQSSVTFTLGATSNLENLTLTGTTAINGIGNALNNFLTGNAGNNNLNGGAGNDTLNGGTGTDTLVGGDGDDTFVVDTTTDTITETATGGVDTVQSSVTYTLGATSNLENLTLTGTTAINGTGNTLNNVITGNSAANTLNGGTGVDSLIGGDGDDIYVVDTTTDIITETATGGVDTVQSSVTFTLGSNVENLTLTGTTAINGTGNELDNVLTGTSGNNTLTGGAGNDTLNGLAGTDTLVGGDGNDIYIVDSTTDTITETATGGIDSVQSSVTFTLGATSNLENLTLTGTTAINGTGNALDNVLTGNSGNNTLTGGDGSDTLNGGAGTDTLVGGNGNDTYIVDSTTDTITETSTGGTDTVQSSVTYTLGATSNLENLILTGTTAINGTGNTLNNVITGNSAANTLNGGTGVDTLIGGDGDDIYVVDTATDTITETATGGIDTVQSSVTYSLGTDSNLENLTLTGTTAINGTGNDLDNTLTGNSGNNILTAGVGNDTLNGAAGTDTLVGGDGNDIYIVDSTTDTITETATGGIDTVQSSVTFTLGATSNLENLTLTGTTAINGIGNALNNFLTGNAGNNNLNGGAGNDTLNGGTGTDTLVGGDGDDTFVVDTTTDTITETATGGVDTVQSSVTYTLGATSNLENLTLTGTTAINGTGNTLNNVITGNSAANTLNGGTGVDSLIGGDGDDIYVVDTTTDIITETATGGVDTVQSSVTFTLGSNVENLTLTGTTAINGTGNELDNVLTGTSGNNTLTGGAGNDTLNGLAGTDTLVGGDGNDIYIVDSTTDTITETATGGIDSVQSSVTFTLGATSNLENLTLTGTTAINGTGNALDNVLTGNSGNNTLTGGDGSDTLNGGAGTDTLVGGNGNDTYIVDSTTDTITETSTGGTDTVQSSVTFTLGATSNLENLILTGTTAINGTGNSLTNFLVGNLGNNILTDSTGGNDVLQGLAGNDTLSDVSGNNLLDGGQGVDTLNAGDGSDILIGGKDNDTITTGQGADLILFNKGDGIDIINSSIYSENTLSLGGGISYDDLSLSRSVDDLILKLGSSDQIVFKDWYNAATGEVRSTFNLQVIAESMEGFELGGSNEIKNNKVEIFHFVSLVNSFDSFGSPSDWKITDEKLSQFLIMSSDFGAFGGDIAYQYGLNGTVSGIGISSAQTVINNGYVGQSAQAINDPSSWANETIKLS